MLQSISENLEIPLRIVRFPRARLYEADEVFLTGSVKEIFPVTRIDGRVIASGKPGPLTVKIAKAYKDLVAQRLSFA
jgi:branched-chain amino acid aminotransferase